MSEARSVASVDLVSRGLGRHAAGVTRQHCELAQRGALCVTETSTVVGCCGRADPVSTTLTESDQSSATEGLKILADLLEHGGAQPLTAGAS